MANNNLFLLGGFDIPGGNAITDIWQFDPSTNAWEQKNPLCLSPLVIYRPLPLAVSSTRVAAAISPAAYSQILPTPLSMIRERTVSPPLLHTKGHRQDQSAQLQWPDVCYGWWYNPSQPGQRGGHLRPWHNTWSIGIPFVNGRRNFATDTDGTTNIWLVGGYDVSGVPWHRWKSSIVR